MVYKTPGKKLFGKLAGAKTIKSDLNSKMFALFKQADTSGDGLVDKQEFVTVGLILRFFKHSILVRIMKKEFPIKKIKVWNSIPNIRSSIAKHTEKRIDYGQAKFTTSLENAFDFIDSSGDGNISYMEFLEAFHIEEGEDLKRVSDGMTEPITMILFRYRACIRSACSLFDSPYIPFKSSRVLDNFSIM